MCRLYLCLLVFLTNSFLCKFVSSATPNSKVMIPCTDDADCSEYGNATCSEEGTCLCNHSHLCDTKVIKMVTRVGEKCQSNEECNIKYAECRKFKCLCKDGSVKSTDGKECLIVSDGLHGNCEENVQCITKIPNTICKDSKCECDNTNEYEGQCYKKINLGQTCKSDPECGVTNLTVCHNAVCSCSKGYVASIKRLRCLPSATGHNSPCNDHIQCSSTLGDYSKCKDGSCQCKELYHYKESINKCVQDILIGERCEKHSDCHDLNPASKDRLECIYGVCECRSFFTNKNGICVENSSTRLLVPLSALPVLYALIMLFK